MPRDPGVLVGDLPHICREGSLFWDQADITGTVDRLLSSGPSNLALPALARRQDTLLRGTPGGMVPRFGEPKASANRLDSVNLRPVNSAAHAVWMLSYSWTTGSGCAGGTPTGHAAARCDLPHVCPLAWCAGSVVLPASGRGRRRAGAARRRRRSGRRASSCRAGGGHRDHHSAATDLPKRPNPRTVHHRPVSPCSVAGSLPLLNRPSSILLNGHAVPLNTPNTPKRDRKIGGNRSRIPCYGSMRIGGFSDGSRRVRRAKASRTSTTSRRALRPRQAALSTSTGTCSASASRSA